MRKRESEDNKTRKQLNTYINNNKNNNNFIVRSSYQQNI